MLVYVNQLEFQNANQLPVVFNTISGWLHSVTKRRFTSDELKSGEEFFIDKYKIRTYMATQYEPHMYSVLLTHPDDTVRGRHWVTEIGVKSENNTLSLSVLLETNDISTQVKGTPITTRPKLVRFLLDNAKLSPKTIGVSVRKYKNDDADFQLLSAEIERDDRSYPLILVSNGADGRPLVNPYTLQSQLIGLAQVALADGDIDSWEMEKHLTRKYSAWGGAINIVYPRRGRTSCPSHLLLNTKIDEWLTSRVDVSKQILSLVTHTTNGFHRKEHFSPTDTRLKRQRDHRVALRLKFDSMVGDTEYKELAEEAFQQLDAQESIIDNMKLKHKEDLDSAEFREMELQDDIKSIQDESSRLRYVIEDLKGKLNQSSKLARDTDGIMPPQDLIDAFCTRLTPPLCLKIIHHLYCDKVIILQSAFDSAEESVNFKNSEKLLSYLSKLASEYVDAIQGGGDSKGKHIFGDAFSAGESETVENSQKLSEMRTFDYAGKKVQMFRHLRFGTSRNPDETLRVHFHWDADNKIIVIGYCGPHLPVVST